MKGMLSSRLRWILQSGVFMLVIFLFSISTMVVLSAAVSSAALDVEIRVDPAPDSKPMAPAEFEFEAIIKGGEAESVIWDFTADEITPETCEDELCWHEFKKYGTYPVTLTVKDTEGNEIVKTVEILDIEKRPGCPY